MKVLATLLVFFTTTTAAWADLPDRSIIFLQCLTPDGDPVSGSGVLVSTQGHVLTARHVAPAGYKCKARRGEGSGEATLDLDFIRESQFDASLWKLTTNNGYPFFPVKFVALDPTLRGREIRAMGFSRNSPSQISERAGVISTPKPDASTGHFETDVITARGMSGGPVLLYDTLVGIVAGSKIDPVSANAASYDVTAAQVFAEEFDLIPAELKNTTDLSRIAAASPKAVAAMDWTDAAARLQAERGAAVGCARAVKRRVPENSNGYFDAEDAYEAARTEMNSVLARLDTALITEVEESELTNLPARLEAITNSRLAFCQSSERLVKENSQDGERFVGAWLKIVGSIADAAAKIWLEYRESDELRRESLRTVIEDAKWPAFTDIS